MPARLYGLSKFSSDFGRFLLACGILEMLKKERFSIQNRVVFDCLPRLSWNVAKVELDANHDVAGCSM
jgi:hypothetical protein